jgi:pimeloyl-ACP methyl ester carboxylesterase
VSRLSLRLGPGGLALRGLQLLSATVFALAWTQLSALEPRHESGILPIDPPTPFIHYFGANPPAGRVLVVHGLDVSKEVVRLFSAALADGGFEVYAIDLPGHGDSIVPFDTDLAEHAIHSAKAFLGDKTIVAGHSMGASLLLDLAETESFSTMVLLAPPPLSISEIRADRVLISAGEIDIPIIRKFVPIVADVGHPHVTTRTIPWGGHSAPIFSPAAIRQVVEWLGGDAANTKTTLRIAWIVVMFVAAVTLGIALIPGPRGQSPAFLPARIIVVQYVAASGIALLALKFVNPARPLRLFATDYLLGFLFVAGVVLTVADLYQRRWAVIDRPYNLSTAVICAVFVIAVPGLIVVSRLLHMWLSDGRWWRFPLIALAGLPLLLSDELTIRRIASAWKRHALAVLTRGLLLAFTVTGVLTLNRDKGFLVVILPLLTVFWVALWFAAGVVHRRTQSPLAAALFAAIVQGWVFAAWFVTI